MGSRLPNVTLLHWAQQKYALVGCANRNVHNRDSDAGRRAGINCGCDYEDPATTEAIEAYDARTGEKLDSEEVRKGRAREVRELDEFEVKKWKSMSQKCD